MSAGFTTLEPWAVCSNGGHWYVIREGGRKVLSGSTGNYRRFGSRKTAQAAADAENGTLA